MAMPPFNKPELFSLKSVIVLRSILDITPVSYLSEVFVAKIGVRNDIQVNSVWLHLCSPYHIISIL